MINSVGSWFRSVNVSKSHSDFDQISKKELM